MAAPTPVSAYLHSATMVKAGIFLMARMWPVLSGTPEWFMIVTTAGLITMVLGAVIALFKHDLKALLGLLDGVSSWFDHHASRHRYGLWRDGRRVPYPQPRDIQGRALYVRRDC